MHSSVVGLLKSSLRAQRPQWRYSAHCPLVTTCVKPISLPALSLTLGGLQFGDEAGENCLAIHGWMDNAASFIPLARAMPEYNTVAIDLPGHGHSEHLPDGCHYHLLDQVQYVLAAANALGWDRFNIVAHSLGACIAPFVAVAAPERVSRLIMVDGIGPQTEPAAALPERLARSVTQTLETRQRLKRIYSTVEDAIDARLAATDMHPDNAALIVNRSLVKTDGGFTWRFDNKIRLPSPSYLSEEQVITCLGKVACPSLLVLASNGVKGVAEHATTRAAALKKGVVHSLEGNHHVHMDSADAVAAAIRKFFLHSTH